MLNGKDKFGQAKHNVIVKIGFKTVLWDIEFIKKNRLVVKGWGFTLKMLVL